MQRLVITLLLTLGALVVLFALTRLGSETDDSPAVTSPQVVEQEGDAPADGDPAAVVEQDPGAAPPPPPPGEVTPDDYAPIPGLAVQVVEESQPDPTLGSTEPEEETNPYTFETQFTPFGAGVRHILLSRYSTSAQQHEPYPLQQRLLFDYVQVGGESVPTYRYPMAAYSVTVNGTRVYLYHQRWEVIEETDTSAAFQLTLVNEDAEPVLRITRTWEIAPDDYNIRLAQRLQNLSDQPLRVVFSQQGPGEMNQDPGYIGDQRHVVVGYLRPRRNQPEVKDPTTEDFYLSRRNIMGAESPVIWPPVEGDPNRDLLWVAMTNRYFAASLFVPVRENEEGRLAVRPLEPLFPTVRRDTWEVQQDDPSLALMLDSAPLELTANSAATLRTKLYAGPKKPALLKSEPHYVALNMGQLIRYNLGGPCAILTFAWLGEGLLAFLTFIHDVFMDWGLAIILLVAVVRLVLHPLTKRSQINMMKMGKQMQALQPEIERLKKKHGDDQKKLQQEMLKLYQEKGVNPFAMGLGCLPMFVQMPIWIALYAMLYFAIELRHSPAFWGVFQWISNDAWPFLADLSDQDRFIPFGDGIPLFFGFTLSSLNLLPLLMMVVFYFQQKYMAPPPNPNMTDEQKMQQKMMRYMIMIFPVILYLAPSGLNLYILASTSVGIFESMRVRAHLKELEDQGKLFQPKKKKEGGLWDRLQKAAEQQQKAMEEKQAQTERGPKKVKNKKKKKP